MGVVGDQPSRIKNFVWGTSEKELIASIETYEYIAEKTGVTVDQVMRAKEVAIQEAMLRFHLQDGDYRDEHVTGIVGAMNTLSEELHLLGDVADAIEGLGNIAQAIEESGASEDA